MYSRIKKIKKSLETSSTKIFLKNIGIKQTYIKKFINTNEKVLENEDNKLAKIIPYLGFCYPITAIQLEKCYILCPKEHSLPKFITEYDGFGCDICGAR